MVSRPPQQQTQAQGARSAMSAFRPAPASVLGVGADRGWVGWGPGTASLSYPAAEGAGAKNMRDLVAQLRATGDGAADLLDVQAAAALALESRVAEIARGHTMPTANFGAPLAASVRAFAPARRPDRARRQPRAARRLPSAGQTPAPAAGGPAAAGRSTDGRGSVAAAAAVGAAPGGAAADAPVRGQRRCAGPGWAAAPRPTPHR